MISGLLNIDKPKGITSHDVVARVRKLSRQRKVGHSGTLDPMATGVLLVCLGQATRLIEYIQSGRKQYRATIRFGITTDTLDADGQVITKNDPSHLTETQLRQLLPIFQGEINQTPPIFSAIKKNGQPLYKLARAGQTVETEPRQVTIDSITWVTWHPPDLTLDIVCSPGTYIRSLARDLGDAAGPGAHLIALTRTANSGWSLDQAIGLDDLERQAGAGAPIWEMYLQPLDDAIPHLPRISLNAEATTNIQHGRPIELGEQDVVQTMSLLRAYAPNGRLLAILTRVESDDTLWRPKKVFHSGETD